MSTTEISNSDDVIDSRDVTARIEELETERGTLADAVSEAKERLQDAQEGTAELAKEEAHATAQDVEEESEELEAAEQAVEDAEDALADWQSEYAEELETLRALAEEGSSSADWSYGEILIRDAYFEDYARELAEDCCSGVSKGLEWPLNCIDWVEAASQLQQDYMSVDFAGETYWIRA